MEPTQEIADNPVVQVKTAIPPALLDAIAEDPENARDYFRRIATIQHHELYLIRRTLTPAQRLQLADAHAKLAGLEPKKLDAAQLGGGVSITINMPSKSRPPVVFQGDAAEVVDVQPETETRD